MQLIITGTGMIRCLYGEEIPLASLGRLEIRRASTIEPDAEGRWWADLALCGGPQVGPYPRRSNALEAEAAWLEEHWLSPSPQASRDHGIPNGAPPPHLHKENPISSSRSHQVGRWPLLLLCGLLLASCGEDTQEQARQAEAQRQAQLAAEQAQRIKAEQAARTAEESRTYWVATVGAGACVMSVIVLLVGVHIGARAVALHRRKDPQNG